GAHRETPSDSMAEEAHSTPTASRNSASRLGGYPVGHRPPATISQPATGDTVRHDERPSGQLRLQRFGLVVRIEDGWLPGHEVGVGAGEGLEVVCRGSLQTLMNQKEIGPGDRLVVAVRLAQAGGEALDPRSEARQCFERRQSAE